MDPLISADKTPLVFGTDTEISSFTDEPTNIETNKKKRISFLPLAAVILFGLVYMAPIMKSYPAAHSCFAILVLASFLWGTEGIPAYATAYLIPALAVWLQISIDPETHLRVSGPDAAQSFSWKFMDPIIFIFLGSMTMSECLSKLHITDRVSQFVFKRLSKNPKIILLTLMLLNLFIAAFLSNVASTTLILTFSIPIIRSLDPDDPYIKAILFGIAWSGNAGGMPTPIASPQNVLALDYMKGSKNSNISFIEWMAFGFPVSILICVSEWAYLIFRFKPKRATINVSENSNNFDPWNLKHTYTVIITVLTIILWTLEEKLPSILGHTGITALIPVVCFFGSGMLQIEDFHSIRWSTLALMGGGLALGEAMKVSGLLDLISSSFGNVLKKVPMWPLLAIFLLIIGILASLINSTSAASIIYPVIAILAEPTHHTALFVTLSALMISGSQLFHISSFPNALASGVCKHLPGQPDQVTNFSFLEGPEFFIIGWPTLFMSILIIASIGYGITYAMEL